MSVPALLAVDLGRRTGFAIGAFADTKPVTGVWPLPPTDPINPRAARLASLENMLISAFDRWAAEGFDIRFCIHAMPFIGRNIGEVRQGLGLLGMLEAECWRRRIRCLEQPESTVRKDVLGRGQGKTEVMKRLVMSWCDREGINATDDNAGDASVLWRWARDELVRQRRFA